MEEIKSHLEDITEIRSLMENSTKFLSLSGLSGVAAGICALLGAGVAYFYLGGELITGYGIHGTINPDFLKFFLLDAGIVLITALSFSIFLSTRMAKKKGLPIWNKTAKDMIIAMLLPLAAGGIFSLIQLSQGVYGFVAATTLLFYGMALLNAGKYTIKEIRVLGILQMVLGLACALLPGFGLYFWALGFGIFHIIYGIVIYMKYEK